MDKEVIKILLIITLVSCYLVDMFAIFYSKPLDILIANINVWVIMIAMIIGFVFVEWLND